MKKKKYLLKMKEKRKEVSCDVTLDIINYLFVLTYLNFELQDANLDAKWKEMGRNQKKRAALRKKMKEALSCGDGPDDADGREEEEINIVEELSENSEEEDETQPPHGNEKSGANVNEDEGEESSDDEEYSHSRFLLETRDRVLGLGRGRLED